ncbi:MAG TPA: hypothetical protein VE046_10980 [Steroidobacteraceae bacterium]|nr:hypothetical protein [Steroidobacteraceae bacterium]
MRWRVTGSHSPDAEQGRELAPWIIGLASLGAGAETEVVASLDGGATTEGTTLYRVFGKDAQGLSETPQWFSTLDPSKVANYRDAAGLFPGNSGQFVLEGTLTDSSGVIFTPATPGPGGIGGGLPSVLVPNPARQICVVCVSGVNPPF